MNENTSFHDLGTYHGETTHATPTAVDSSAEPFPFLDMGTSFIIGLAVGYFLKKSFKFLLLLLGFGLVVLFILESQGTFHVDDQMIQDGVSSGVNSFQNLVGMIKNRLANMELSTGVGAIAGFFTGLKFG